MFLVDYEDVEPTVAAPLYSPLYTSLDKIFPTLASVFGLTLVE